MFELLALLPIWANWVSGEKKVEEKVDSDYNKFHNMTLNEFFNHLNEKEK